MPFKSWPNKYNRTEFTVWRIPNYPDDYYSNTVVIDTVNSVATGENIPNWKERIANGDDATTGLYGTRYSLQKWTPVRYTVSFPENTGVVSCTGYPTGGVSGTAFPSPIYTPTSKALARAESNFMKSYRSQTRQFAGGNFLAEIMDTARLLRNPVKGMYSLTQDLTQVLRGMKKFKPRRYRAALSDAWLTYQFGMKPLASDANDYCKALRALSSGRTVDLTRLIGTGSDEYADPPYTGTVGFLNAPNLCENTVEYLRKDSVTIRGATRTGIPGSELPVPMRFGLMALDIVPAVWEAIPFSFLVDYFTNVGDTLDAYMLRFVDFAWINQTHRIQTEIRSTPWRVPPTDEQGTTYQVDGGATRFSTITVTRESRLNDFGGIVYGEIPGIKSTKWLNIAALVNSIFLSRP